MAKPAGLKTPAPVDVTEVSKRPRKSFYARHEELILGGGSMLL